MNGVRFRIHGRVQGVGFRWWVRQHARDLGLVGTVQNRPDGSVEVVATGSAEALATLRGLLQQGPPNALVAEVLEDTSPLSAHAPPHSFTVLH